MPLHAVITGDFIASRRVSPAALEDAMTLVAGASSGIGMDLGQDTRFTRFRGDGWQIYLHDPGQSLHAVLRIAAVLRGMGSALSTRQSIGIGPVTNLPPLKLSAASGPAFEASGIGLDQMDRARRLAIAGQVQPWHQALIALADWHAARWSREQAEAVALRLAHPTTPAAELAADIGITRQAFDARLATCGWPAWEPSLAAFATAWEAAP